MINFVGKTDYKCYECVSDVDGKPRSSSIDGYIVANTGGRRHLALGVGWQQQLTAFATPILTPILCLNVKMTKAVLVPTH